MCSLCRMRPIRLIRPVRPLRLMCHVCSVCPVHLVRLLALPWAITFLFFALQPSLACTEDRLLQLIGQIEAPGGYDTVYYGARIKPPRPITQMTVGEVLAWQRNTVRGGSVSSAAGRYQIIRPTLQGLVNKGAVSTNETFSAATQDRLGRHLLRETGYRNGDTSTATANRIAGVWAALPRLDGPGAGKSAYEGIAGNHALISANTYRGVLNCSIDIPQVEREATTIRMGQRFGFNWDQLLQDMANGADRVLKGATNIAIALLLFLFLIDLILRAGGWIMRGQLSGMASELVFRLLVVCLCLALLWSADTFIEGISDIAYRLAGMTGGKENFTLGDYAASRTALLFSLLEGIMTYPVEIRVFVYCVCVVLVIIFAIQIGFIIYRSANLIITGAAGLIATGFGGLRETTPISAAYIRFLLSAAFSLTALLVVIATIMALGWDIRALANPAIAALTIMLLEMTGLVLLVMLPPSIGRIIS